MYEMLLGSGASERKYYPQSGPGAKYLKAGNEDIGYFGIVTSAEFVSGLDVSTALNLTAGVAFNDTNNSWLKFIYKGKFLFVAYQPTRRMLSWNDVYLAGAIYGVKGNGAYPMPGNPVDQWRVLVKPEGGVPTPWKFAIRSMNGAAEPFNPADTSVLRLATGNEYNDLLYRLVDVAGLPNTGVWEKWGATALGPSTASATILKETSSGNVLNASVRTGNGTTLVGAKNTLQATDASFRPVLELLDDTYAYDPYRVDGDAVGPAVPSIIAMVTPSDTVYNPKNTYQVEWAGKQPVILDKLASDSVYPPRNTTASTLAVLNAVTLTGASADLAILPKNPVWSIANINPVTISGAYIP